LETVDDSVKINNDVNDGTKTSEEETGNPSEENNNEAPESKKE